MRLFSFWNCLLQPVVEVGWAGSRDVESAPAGPPADKPATEADGMRCSGLVKTEAEDLLDWLEANGCANYEISSMSGNTFAVRWWK